MFMERHWVSSVVESIERTGGRLKREVKVECSECSVSREMEKYNDEEKKEEDQRNKTREGFDSWERK